MRPDEDTNNSVSNTAASEDVGAVSSSDMGGMGVSIGGTGSGYDPNYGSVGPASSLATDLGMGAYGTSAMSDFSRGESDRNYFSPTPIDDYSLTRGQTKYGYSIGTYGPNYGLTQLPESYTTDKGSRRVPEDEARTYANFLNVDINAIPGYSREPTTIAGKIGAFIGGNLGSPVGRDFVVNPQTGFIGQVVDERSQIDLIGNVLSSLINPLPISPSIETAKVKDIRNIREKEKELQMYTGPMFSGPAGKTVPLSEYEKQMAENNKSSTGEGGMTTYASTTLPNKSVVARALSGINVNVASMIQQSSTPSIEPASYAPAYQENTFASSYMAPMSYGGVAESNIAQEMQMGGLATKMTMDIPDVMNLAGQAEQIKTNPEQFFIDPNEAMTAADLKAVYDYNKKITNIANGRMQLPTPMQAGGEAVNGPVGFVDSPPEQVAPTDTVADDVPMDVEEGTFILNAASVEFAGSEDIKRMLLNAMKEAERQGIDISTDDNKISREETVSLLVSRGEVVVPTTLAKIIGYDRLEKINNRGKKEVARREQEAQQQQPQEPQAPAQPTNPAEGMAMAGGGFADYENFSILPREVLEDARLKREYPEIYGEMQREIDDTLKDLPPEVADKIIALLQGDDYNDNVVSRTDVQAGSTEDQRAFTNITGVTPQNAQNAWRLLPSMYKSIESLEPETQKQAREALDRFSKYVMVQMGDNPIEPDSEVNVFEEADRRFQNEWKSAIDFVNTEAQTVSKTIVGEEEPKEEGLDDYLRSISMKSGGFVKKNS